MVPVCPLSHTDSLFFTALPAQSVLSNLSNLTPVLSVSLCYPTFYSHLTIFYVFYTVYSNTLSIIPTLNKISLPLHVRLDRFYCIQPLHLTGFKQIIKIQPQLKGLQSSDLILTPCRKTVNGDKWPLFS